MAEGESPELQHTTPQELNAKLTNIIMALPSTPSTHGLPMGPEQPSSMMTGPGQTDNADPIRAQLEELIQYASITPSFRTYIIDEFTNMARISADVDIEPDVFESMFFFLDRNDLDSGGIFDPQQAAKLERRALAEKTVSTMRGERLLTRITGNRQDAYRPEYNAIEIWRRQFQERYGDQGIAPQAQSRHA